MICGKEGVEADAEALNMIAAAAEGSVRDGLSILDQAIAHADLGGDGKVSADQVRDMLGLADKSVQRRLFAALLGGDGAVLLDMVEAQFSLGVEPHALLRGAMETTHKVTVAQLGKYEAVSAEEREALDGWAQGLSAGQLHRLWQLLLKGFEEVRTAPDPLVAAQMALLRVMHAADMPDPGQLVKRLEALGSAPLAQLAEGAQGAASAPQAAAPAVDWRALVDRVDHADAMVTASTMRMQVRVVSLEWGKLRFSKAPRFKEDPTADIIAGLLKATGERWSVELCDEEGAPTLIEQDEAAKAAGDAALRLNPLVEATLAAFPGAEIVTEDDSGEQNWRNRA